MDVQKSSHFLSSVAGAGAAVQAFSGAGDPELGQYHPLNTFFTPFTATRGRASWFFKTVVPLRAEGGGAWSISAVEARGADVLMATDLVGRVETDWLPADPGGDSFEIDSSNADSVAVHGFAAAFPTQSSEFFALDMNRGFPLAALGNARLRFRGAVSGGSAIVASLLPGEAAAVAARPATSALPPIVSASLVVPVVSRIALSGPQATAEISARDVQHGCIVQFVWWARTRTARASLWCRAPRAWADENDGEDRVYIIRDLALASPFLDAIPTADGDAWCFRWQTGVAGSRGLPPMIGLDSTSTACEGAGDFVLEIAGESFSFAAISLKFLEFSTPGEPPRWGG
jgi:hypothetical protein